MFSVGLLSLPVKRNGTWYSSATRRAGVGADIEVVVPLHDQRNRQLHNLARDLLAVDLEHARATATDAADRRPE